jgi:hypothetical protein
VHGRGRVFDARVRVRVRVSAQGLLYEGVSDTPLQVRKRRRQWRKLAIKTSIVTLRCSPQACRGDTAGSRPKNFWSPINSTGPARTPSLLTYCGPAAARELALAPTCAALHLVAPTCLLARSCTAKRARSPPCCTPLTRRWEWSTSRRVRVRGHVAGVGCERYCQRQEKTRAVDAAQRSGCRGKVVPVAAGGTAPVPRAELRSPPTGWPGSRGPYSS